MCGIAGVVSSSPGSLPRIEPMLAALRHRGPDGQGEWSDEHCVLGQQRLAIIDLSDAGQAPLSNEDRTVWVTFNGEIYNFRDLRRELESLGHRFRSSTDTEVIVHAYEEWGLESIQRLRGMFAFALWDQRSRKLLLARDRVGKKPLFYTWQGDRLLFASELQALLAMRGIERRPDNAAIHEYLSWGYIPAPLTGFVGIRKLPPAHHLQLQVPHGERSEKVTRYWDLAYAPKLSITPEEAANEISAALTDAVRIRLNSDVPLGALLSGGIDSSIIVALMARVASEPVKTFSIGFEEAAYDELVHARRVAERWGTDHHEDIVRPNAHEVLPLLIRHFGEPFADSSAIPSYYVAKMARRHVTVALNGDGGDELFGGYDRYWAARLAQRVSRLPGLGSAAVIADRLAPADPKNTLYRAARFLHAAGSQPAQRYSRWMSYFSSGDKASLFTREFLAERMRAPSADWFEEMFDLGDATDAAEAAMSADIRSYLPYDLLVKVDIASMANSLEGRSPFLDQRVMELAARLPAGMKIKGRLGKAILKKAFRDLLPHENVTRSKMGFGVPVGKWFRGPLKDLPRDALLSQAALGRGYFKKEAVQQLMDEHERGARDHGSRLWSLLVLEMWHRELVDPTYPHSEPSPHDH